MFGIREVLVGVGSFLGVDVDLIATRDAGGMSGD